MTACYSGSMFQSLPSDINAYAVTAVGPNAEAQAYYCPP